MKDENDLGTSDAERAFVTQLREVLDDSADALDELTSARLTAARKRAVEAAARPRWRPWLAAAAGAAFATAAAVFVVPMVISPAPEQLVATSFEQEELELISELDFLLWLDESDAAL